MTSVEFINGYVTACSNKSALIVEQKTNKYDIETPWDPNGFEDGRPRWLQVTDIERTE